MSATANNLDEKARGEFARYGTTRMFGNPGKVWRIRIEIARCGQSLQMRQTFG